MHPDVEQGGRGGTTTAEMLPRHRPAASWLQGKGGKEPGGKQPWVQQQKMDGSRMGGREACQLSNQAWWRQSKGHVRFTIRPGDDKAERGRMAAAISRSMKRSPVKRPWKLEAKKHSCSAPAKK